MKQIITLIFIVAIFSILAIVCCVFPQPKFEFCSLTLRFPKLSEVLQSSTENAISADSVVMAVEQSLSVTAVVDSAELARQDSLKFYKTFFTENPARIYCPKDDPKFFFRLFAALDEAHSNPLHIIHYGDSQIEGDRISGTLRRRLQKMFGGGGPGLVPLQQPIPRASISQSISDSVSMKYAGGMIGSRGQHNRYGAMAQMCHIVRDTLTFSLTQYHSKSIQRVKLFVGAIDSAFSASTNGVRKNLGKTHKIHTLTWQLPKSTNNIRMALRGTADIYGIALDGGNGVSLTNIPMRGSDGTFFSRIDGHEMKQMLRELDTRFIIMEFGGNALPMLKDSSSVRKYSKFFGLQIDHMKTACPESDIMVIGPADMSIKIDGVLQTYPLLPYLVECMKGVCMEKNAAFWNMYEVMGGRNSMPAWVAHQPIWAAPDYIHFSSRGAERISDLLWQSLMNYYNYYKLVNN
ncbi:MAG: hypothetical protein J6Y72_10770 [Bacteroidales bacterium]|nr:hypothetical protein [Bacteroidales bacterium]